MRDEVAAYVRKLHADGLSSLTLKVYRHYFNVLLRFLTQQGCLRVDDVTPSDLDAFMAQMAAEHRAHGSRVAMAVHIRRFFHWLVDRDRLAWSPAGRLPIMEDDEPALPPPPLSEAAVRAIIDGLPRATVIDMRMRCLVEILYATAARIGEACALDVSDIDLEQRTMSIRNGKGGKSRVLPLMEAALAAVRDWLALRRTMLKGPDHGALFLNQYGRRLSVDAAREWLATVNAARGPDTQHLYFHLFRHSLAVALLRRGADVRIVQEALGHARLDTTKVYLRLVPGELAAAYHRAMPDIDVGLQPPKWGLL